MMFKTHLVFGFLIGLFFIQIFNVSYPIIFVLLVTLFSSLPDIDHPKSKIGRKLFFISWPISLVFKHRGFFHSVFPAIGLFIIFSYFNLSFLGLAIAIGYIAHLLGDAVTKEGINFLHPLATFRIQGPITTGKTLEFFIYLGLIFLDIFFTAKFFNLI